jgi:hypothetical protein
MTAFDPGKQLRDHAHDAGWDGTDLWIASVALGSNLDLGQVNAIAAGASSPTRDQYDVLAAALNEHFAALGRDHPGPTWEGQPRTTPRGSLSN